MAKYVLARYHRRRAEWIDRLGGKCVECGTDEDLEFDHIDPSTKSFNVGDAFAGWAEARIAEEMTKCQLLCEYHHDLKSAAEQSVEHGQGVTGKKSCSCELCGPLKVAYNRRYKNVKTPRDPTTSGINGAHGTRVMYGYHKCRCDECRAYTSRVNKEYREQRKNK